MITTPRSLAAGLTSWLLAFVIAYLGHINPARLNKWGVVLLILSAVCGFLTAIAVGKRFCHRDFERGNAVMIFAVCFFTGIYAPITAIWANAPFYEWSVTQVAKPKSGVLGSWMVPAVERTAISYYLGLFLILWMGYAAGRRMAAPVEVAGIPGATLVRRLEWVDGWGGLGAFIVGFPFASRKGSYGLSAPEQWCGFVGGCFLVCFLFRSLRLECLHLRESLSLSEASSLSATAKILGIAGLVVFLLLSPILLNAFDVSNNRLQVAIAVSLLLFWVTFERAAKPPEELIVKRALPTGRFVVRAATWSGLGFALLFMVIIYSGIGKAEMETAPDLATPFALTVVALRPLAWSLVGLGGGALYGSFFLSLCLYRRAKASEQIRACIQGGVAVATVCYVLTVAFAMSIALLTVDAIPTGDPSKLKMGTLYTALALGDWVHLSKLYMSMLAAFVTVVGAAWATGAALENGAVWVWRKLRSSTE